MKIIWDESGKKFYETGVKNGVIYIQDVTGSYPLGIPWNGLTAVTESPSGAEATPLYADDSKYMNLMSAEEFGATIEAYMYPDEFEQCDGTAEIAPGTKIGQQNRKPFGLVYKTTIGNDTEGADHGYKLHIIYGANASPSEKAYKTVNDSPEAITFSWEIKTTPIPVPGYKPTASLTIDSTKVSAEVLTAIEDILFGTDVAEPRLPLPAEIITIMGGAAPEALALSSILPADDANAVAAASNIVLTFNNKILKESVVITSAAGVIVAGTKTWDATGKILTFDPTVNLAAGTTYLVAISGVVDIYNQALAATVKNFATA